MPGQEAHAHPQQLRLPFLAPLVHGAGHVLLCRVQLALHEQVTRTDTAFLLHSATHTACCCHYPYKPQVHIYPGTLLPYCNSSTVAVPIRLTGLTPPRCTSRRPPSLPVAVCEDLPAQVLSAGRLALQCPLYEADGHGLSTLQLVNRGWRGQGLQLPWTHMSNTHGMHSYENSGCSWSDAYTAAQCTPCVSTNPRYGVMSRLTRFTWVLPPACHPCVAKTSMPRHAHSQLAS